REDVAGRRVSSLSFWADSAWRFPVYTAGHGSHATVNWDFEMPGGSSMDPCWADLLDLGRRFIWSLCCNNQRGKRPKPLALPEFARCTRHLLQWMAWNDYANFSELDPSAAADYTQCIADEKAPASHSDE